MLLNECNVKFGRQRLIMMMQKIDDDDDDDDDFDDDVRRSCMHHEADLDVRRQRTRRNVTQRRTLRSAKSRRETDRRLLGGGQLRPRSLPAPSRTDAEQHPNAQLTDMTSCARPRKQVRVPVGPQRKVRRAEATDSSRSCQHVEGV